MQAVSLRSLISCSFLALLVHFLAGAQELGRRSDVVCFQDSGGRPGSFPEKEGSSQEEGWTACPLLLSVEGTQGRPQRRAHSVPLSGVRYHGDKASPAVSELRWPCPHLEADATVEAAATNESFSPAGTCEKACPFLCHSHSNRETSSQLNFDAFGSPCVSTSFSLAGFVLFFHGIRTP